MLERSCITSATSHTDPQKTGGGEEQSTNTLWSGQSHDPGTDRTWLNEGSHSHSGNTNVATALVTGSNKGIGKQIARQLAEVGLTVYVGARDAERGQGTVDEIGGGGLLVELDVTDSDSMATAAGQIDSRYRCC